MIVVDVPKLEVLVGVKLNGEDVVGRLAIVGAIEEVQVLYWCSREILARCDQQGEAMGAKSSQMEVIPNTKEAEKDCTVLLGESRRHSGSG